jgi:hypothetical protein
MPRWLFAAILVVSASGMMFGLEWRPVPEPHYQPATHVAVVNHSLPLRPAISDAASSPIVPAAPVTEPVKVAKPAEPAKIVAGAQPIPPAAGFTPNLPPAAANPPLPDLNPSPPAAPVTDASAPSSDIAAAEPAPKCDIRACEAAYFTFRASDCTYQPANGPRRFCNKGNPPQAAAPAPELNAQASACNVQACRQAYFTFNPADCTYQPSNGSRRVCTK